MFVLRLLMNKIKRIENIVQNDALKPNSQLHESDQQKSASEDIVENGVLKKNSNVKDSEQLNAYEDKVNNNSLKSHSIESGQPKNVYQNKVDEVCERYILQSNDFSSTSNTKFDETLRCKGKIISLKDNLLHEGPVHTSVNSDWYQDEASKKFGTTTISFEEPPQSHKNNENIYSEKSNIKVRTVSNEKYIPQKLCEKSFINPDALFPADSTSYLVTPAEKNSNQSLQRDSLSKSSLDVNEVTANKLNKRTFSEDIKKGIKTLSNTDNKYIKKEKCLETLSDSRLTFEEPHEYNFVYQDNLSEELLKTIKLNNAQVRNQSIDFKFPSENSEIGGGNVFFKLNNEVGSDKFKTFKEISEKLKKDISIMVKSEDFKNNIGSNTDILDQFNLLDGTLNQLDFIGRSLSRGGSYFIESLDAKRKEIGNVLSCLKEEVFNTYSRLQPEEKYFLARQGGPMACIFTLFGVLERELYSIFREISDAIKKDHTMNVRDKKLCKKKKCRSARSVPILKQSFEQLKFSAEEENCNEEIIVLTKDVATSMSGNYLTYPLTSLDVSSNKMKICELSDILTMLFNNKAPHEILNKHELYSLIEKDSNDRDSSRMIDKLMKYESEGFVICFIQNCIQITTPENMNFLIKDISEPVKLSEIFPKTSSMVEEIPSTPSSLSTRSSSCNQLNDDSDWSSDSLHYTSVRSDSEDISSCSLSSERVHLNDSEFPEGSICGNLFNAFTEDATNEKSNVKTFLASEVNKSELDNEVIISLDFDGSRNIRFSGDEILLLDASGSTRISQNPSALNSNDLKCSGEGSYTIDSNTYPIWKKLYAQASMQWLQ